MAETDPVSDRWCGYPWKPRHFYFLLPGKDETLLKLSGNLEHFPCGGSVGTVSR